MRMIWSLDGKSLNTRTRHHAPSCCIGLLSEKLLYQSFETGQAGRTYFASVGLSNWLIFLNNGMEYIFFEMMCDCANPILKTPLPARKSSNVSW